MSVPSTLYRNQFFIVVRTDVDMVTTHAGAFAKLDRNVQAPRVHMESQPVSDDLKSEIVQRWCLMLGEDHVSLTDDFFLDLGGTSLKAVELLIDLETHLGLTIPMDLFAEQPTLKRLYEIAGSSTMKSSSSLVPLHPSGHRNPFFFTHAGPGHVLFVQGLAISLGPDQPMYGLQSQGFCGTKKPLMSITEMAAHYIGEMKNVQPQGPYRVGGFCMGAMLALEIACQLQEAGEEVSHLVIFSTDAHWTQTKGLREQIEFHRREVGRLSPDNVTRYLLSRIRFRLYRSYSTMIFVLHGLYQKWGKSFPPRLRHIYIAELNYRASRNFQPRPFNGRLFYIQSAADQRSDPLSFWRTMAVEGVEMITVSGYRHAIFDPPHVETLASCLSECLSYPANVSDPVETEQHRSATKMGVA